MCNTLSVSKKYAYLLINLNKMEKVIAREQAEVGVTKKVGA